MEDRDSPRPLDYEVPPPGSNRGRKILVGILIACGIGGILVFAIMRQQFGHSSMGRNTTPAERCASNMHVIGLAIRMYQDSNQRNYPDSLDNLFSLDATVSQSLFDCPACKDTPSTAATTQAIAADWAKPGHLSYIYIGKGLNDTTATADTIVLYEPLSNHGNAGMNVLFGDGHTEWVGAPIGAKIITTAPQGICGSSWIRTHTFCRRHQRHIERSAERKGVIWSLPIYVVGRDATIIGSDFLMSPEGSGTADTETLRRLFNH